MNSLKGLIKEKQAMQNKYVSIEERANHSNVGSSSTLPEGAVAEKRGGIVVQNLDAWYGSNIALKKVNMTVKPQTITAIIGPSGCGKSTLIRCLNRLHEISHGGRVSGCVLLDGKDIYARDVDPVIIRRRIGMVFQKPAPFPTMSIFDNVAAGLKLNRLWGFGLNMDDIVEKSLRRAALWEEVKDKLKQSGSSLSGGQQQRLCIARALAVEPEILLLDEPCSALDPISTLKIEELMQDLKENYTIVIVTHNMQQAARVSEWTSYMLLGELVEYGATIEVFNRPKDKRTEDYITGRFG
jgi:phosphate transport system ATP-binding protein